MFISKYLLFVMPLVIGTIIWSLSVSDGGSKLEGPQGVAYDIFGWHFIIWFILLIYFIFSLVVWGTFREKILMMLTFSKERDERESYISGRASKATFYSTLAVMILLFFLSGLNVDIYRKPKSQAIDGKRGRITIGYGFEFINSAKKSEKPEAILEVEEEKEQIFKMNGIPFTQESILLFLILYHLASFHLFSRKRLRQ